MATEHDEHERPSGPVVRDRRRLDPTTGEVRGSAAGGGPGGGSTAPQADAAAQAAGGEGAEGADAGAAQADEGVVEAEVVDEDRRES